MSAKRPKQFYRKTEPEVIVIRPQKAQFPSISLHIPELSLIDVITSPVFLSAFLGGFLLMAIGIVGYDVRNNIFRLKQLNAERISKRQEIQLWQQFTASHPGYRDGYFKMAILEYQLGNTNSAREYISKVLSIDSEFLAAKELANRLEK